MSATWNAVGLVWGSFACVAACAKTSPEPASPRGSAAAEVAASNATPRSAATEASINWAKFDAAQAPQAWRQLGITADNYQLVLADIPRANNIRQVMARALVAEGNLACDTIVYENPVCKLGPVDFEELRGDETIESPCLRRRLAHWAMDELDDADWSRPDDFQVLRSLVALPPPETRLIREALEAALGRGTEDQLALAQVAEDGGHELAFSHPELATAASQYHLDGALAGLEVRDHFDIFAAAITKDEFAVAARVAAIGDLVAYARANPSKNSRVLAAIAALPIQAPCVVHAAAVDAYLALGATKLAAKHLQTLPIDVRLCVAGGAKTEGGQAATHAAVFAPHATLVDRRRDAADGPAAQWDLARHQSELRELLEYADACRIKAAGTVECRDPRRPQSPVLSADFDPQTKSLRVHQLSIAAGSDVPFTCP